MKLQFNPYPVLPDLHLFLFFLLSIHQRLSLKHIESQVILVFIILFSGVNTFLMWVMWLDRFSGNMNFFYFQTMVFNMGVTVILI